MSLDENLNRVLARHEELAALMASSTPPSADEFTKLSREYSDLSPIVESITKLRSAEAEAQDLAEMIADPDGDQDMRENMG